MDRQTRIYKMMPRLYKPGHNRNVTAILDAIAAENTISDVQIQNAKDQLFVSKASGQFLDLLASNVGVTRPGLVAFSDEVFRKFIPLASYGPKQVKETIYKCLELLWGQSYLHSTTTAVNPETYDFSSGGVLELTVDELWDIEITFLTTDFADPSAATAAELAAKINAHYSDYVYAYSSEDSIGDANYLAISTTTYGLAGSIQVTGGTANAILAFSTNPVQYTKVSLHEMKPNELVVRIPKDIALRTDSLLWSHHFHADESTIMAGDPETTTATPYWPGSFLYGKSDAGSIALYSTKATLASGISAGVSYSILTFDDVSHFPSAGGRLVFEFGTGRMEKSIRYYNRVSNTELRIDATHVFDNNHAIGSVVNLMDTTPVVPDIDGTDYPVFFVDTEIGEELAGIGLLLLKAAGVIVRFEFIDDE